MEGGGIFIAGMGRRVDRHHVKAIALQLRHLPGGEPEAFREIVVGRRPAELRAQFVVQPGQLAQPLRAPDRDPHRARLAGDRAMHALLDPDRGVGAEFCPELRIIKFRGAHEPDIPLGDEIGEGQSESGIVMRDLHHEPQVIAHELLLGRDVARGGTDAQRGGFFLRGCGRLADVAEVGVEGRPVTGFSDRDAFHGFVPVLYNRTRDFVEYSFLMDRFGLS